VFDQLGLVGCGLMGGSFALALKRAGLVRRVVGFSPSEATRQRALDMGVIDAAALDASQAAHGSDLVLVAVPVAATQSTLESLATALSPHGLLMDVGSTKRDVVQAATLALGDKLATFVPAHPIAGKEVSGVAHADVDLYTGCQVILTPIAQTGTTQLAKAQAVWAALGAQVRTMSALDHDSAFAAVSHLPHMLAFAAMNALNAQDQGAHFLSLAGPGFRDFSRIAASDPAVWRDILHANRDQLLVQSEHLREALQAFEAALAQGDSATLQALITAASQSRAAWSLKR
jgi:prephenate dehydrogenase